jgi:DNA polymerase I-like protein with 3'-5' exonuclease and polymerase domains
MEKTGFARGAEEQKRLIKKYERYTRIIHNQNTRDLGYELNVMSNGPKGQVPLCIFEDLRCPKRKDTGEETLEMLCLNAVKDERRRRILTNILKERKARKTIGTYVKAKTSKDGRFHTTFNITGTETNRTSTSKPKPPVVAEAEGLAFQTLTKHGEVGADLRIMFVVRKGRILMEADESACQARIVSHLARDEDAIALMDRKDFKKNKHGLKDDIHTWTAMLVTQLSFESIDDEVRQLGKKTRHAGNFGMGKRRLSLMAKISEWRAGKCLDAFHAANPKISQIFWLDVQRALEEEGMQLRSCTGLPRQFFEKWGDDMFKEAYAHLPQVIEADHVKAAGIRISERAPWMDFVLEAHDSLLVEFDDTDKKIQEAAKIFKEELEVPIDFTLCSLSRGPLVIPCDIQIGRKDWKHMEKYAA